MFTVLVCTIPFGSEMHFEWAKASLNAQFHVTVTKTIDQVTEPYEFYGDETPLSYDETLSFNNTAKSTILLM